MGKPSARHGALPVPEFIGCVEGTWGSETSQYPQEEKTIVYSVSSGERTRKRPNHSGVIDASRCRCGVVGSPSRFWRIDKESEMFCVVEGHAKGPAQKVIPL